MLRSTARCISESVSPVSSLFQFDAVPHPVADGLQVCRMTFPEELEWATSRFPSTSMSIDTTRSVVLEAVSVEMTLAVAVVPDELRYRSTGSLVAPGVTNATCVVPDSASCTASRFETPEWDSSKASDHWEAWWQLEGHSRDVSFDPVDHIAVRPVGVDRMSTMSALADCASWVTTHLPATLVAKMTSWEVES